MSAILSEYDTIFDVRRFPPGHTLQACAGVELKARPRGHADLLRLIAVTKAMAMHYIERRARRQSQSLARGAGRAKAVDSKVDSNWGQIYDTLNREVASYADTEDGALAAELLARVFPKGLAAVTRLPYEEQVALNEYLVALIRESYADAPARLAFERPLRRIEALLPEYRDALRVPDAVTALEVGEAYADMQVALLRVIGWIMALVDEQTERAELMAPVRDQARRLAAAYAARRRGQAAATDVALDTLDLDPEARAAVEAAAAVEQAIEAEAEAVGDAPDDPAGDALAEDAVPLRPLP